MKLSNYAKIFKALSSEQRLEIFATLYRECCAAEGARQSGKPGERLRCPVGRAIERAFTKVCGCVKLSRSTVSHHFKELQNAGLITCEREGQTYRCKVNEETVNAIREFLA